MGNKYIQGDLVVDGDLIVSKIGDYSEGLAYTLKEDGTYGVSGIGTCADTDIIIPSIYNGKRVTSIDNAAFYDRSSLTNVTIGDGVTSIGDAAFQECTSLMSVIIGDNVTSIGNSAFYNCASLTSVTIPNSVTSIGDNAFRECTSLTSVAIPNSVTSIGKYAFQYCTGLTSITFGENSSLTSISPQMFYNCGSLINITIPNNVSSIGATAFGYCSSLISITIPNSVISIGDRACKGCSKAMIYCEASSQPSGWDADWNFENRPVVWGAALDFIGVNEKLANIPTKVSAFENDSKYVTEDALNGKYSEGLTYTLKDDSTYEVSGIGTCADTDIIIPSIVDGKYITTIGFEAFASCSSLTSITIPDSVTSISVQAFSGCTSLTNITIPDSVTSIGNHAFSGCSSLTSVTIGDSVTSIGNYAFDNCSSLASVTISDSVTSIGKAAFDGCSSLTSVTIPNSVISIDNVVFRNCSSLMSVVIGDGVTTIGEFAFRTCSSLTNITIPDSVASIGANVFYGCTNATIYCEAESQPEGWDANWNPNNRPVVWGAALDFTSVNDKLNILDDKIDGLIGPYSDGLAYTLKEDGTYEVSGIGTCTDTDIIIPSIIDGHRVTSIGRNAFIRCSNLTSITIPNNVTSIGYQAFYLCSSLTSIMIPDSVTSIGNYTFYGCTGLTSVTIGNGVTSIDDYAFYNCSSLTSITIPDSVTSIGVNAFRECTSLTNVTIPKSVTSIGGSAFYNTNATIYCEAESKPDGWPTNWKGGRPVVWGAALDFASVNGKLANGGGGASGGGIIDVAELPTTNIDEKSIYRLTTEGAEVYVKMDILYTLQDFFASMMGAQSNIVTYIVDELPETLAPADQATFTVYCYVVESTGVVWSDIGQGKLPIGALLLGEGADKGWSNDVYAETEQGVYTVRTKTQTLHTNKDGKWTELVSKEYVDKALAKCSAEVIQFTVDDTGAVQGIGAEEREKLIANYHNIILAEEGYKLYRCDRQLDGNLWFTRMYENNGNLYINTLIISSSGVRLETASVAVTKS